MPLVNELVESVNKGSGLSRTHQCHNIMTIKPLYTLHLIQFLMRTKQIKVETITIREKIEARIIYTPFVKSTGQLADIFTKGVPKNQVQNISSMLA